MNIACHRRLLCRSDNSCGRQREADDLFKSISSGYVPEWDASTDIALAQVIRKTAAKYGIRYVLEVTHFKLKASLLPQTVILMVLMLGYTQKIWHCFFKNFSDSIFADASGNV